MKLTIAAIAVLAAMTFNVNAQTVGQRQANQQDRIGNGVSSGALTPHETRKLERKEAGIQREKRALRADGSLSAKDRAKLQKRENHVSREIHKQKHDGQVR